MDKKWTKSQFEHHLHEKHGGNGIASYLKEIVYGGNDGIITTFAVVAGFSGAQAGHLGGTIPLITVLLFGCANLFADGLSMGLGNFLSIRADQDIYRTEKAKEEYEVEHARENEIAETQYLFEAQGFSKKDASVMTEICAKNPVFWVDFMMKYELGMHDPEEDSAWKNGCATFLSFIIFGAIPLLPYILFTDLMFHFYWSCVFTALALITLGLIRSLLSGQSYVRAVLETLLLGGIAAIVAFLVGTLFRG